MTELLEGTVEVRGKDPATPTALRHAAYAAGWKKFEPLWDWLIRARRVARALPILESVLEGFTREGRGAPPARSDQGRLTEGHVKAEGAGLSQGEHATGSLSAEEAYTQLDLGKGWVLATTRLIPFAQVGYNPNQRPYRAESAMSADLSRKSHWSSFRLPSSGPVESGAPWSSSQLSS